ncbi:MAG: dTDP-4-dehydrorhamnose 3,5-epimerase [Trueperaceae bacterium]
MEFLPLAIPEVVLVTPRVHRDARGFFLERYRQEAFAAAGLPTTYVQDNHSRSRIGVLRGLHFQHGAFAQGKLVGVTRGEVLDVAVDLRPGSATFGRWVSAILNDENLRMLWVPRGFAHGFVVRSEVADVVYKTDAPYVPGADAGVRWDDPALAIDWQLDVLPPGAPQVSPRDANLPGLDAAVAGAER